MYTVWITHDLVKTSQYKACAVQLTQRLTWCSKDIRLMHDARPLPMLNTHKAPGRWPKTPDHLSPPET